MNHPLLTIILSASVLVALTLTVHAIGLALLLRTYNRPGALPHLHGWPVTWFLVRVTWWLILIHMTEIAIWGLFYLWQGCMPDAESAFYFSGVTYSTVGYGELVLSQHWRILGPIEALTAILMCGLSTGFFFALVNRLYTIRVHENDE